MRLSSFFLLLICFFSSTIQEKLDPNQTISCGSYENPCQLGGGELLGRGIWLPFLNPEYLTTEEKGESIQLEDFPLDIGVPVKKLINGAYYYLPENVYCEPISECKQDVLSYSSKTETETESEWSKKVTIMIPIPNLFTFKRSKTYKESTKYQYQKETYYAAGYQVCSFSSCRISDYKFQNHFIESVQNLPRFADTTQEREVYENFIRKYGTSYTAEIYAGARAMSKYRITKESEQILHEEGITLTRGITNIFRTKAGLEVESGWSSAHESLWNSVTEEQTTVAIGGNPALAFTDNEAWFESIKDYTNTREITNFREIHQITKLLEMIDPWKAKNMESVLSEYFMKEEPAPYDKIVSISSTTKAPADPYGETEEVYCSGYKFAIAGSCKLYTRESNREREYKIARTWSKSFFFFFS